MKSSRLVRALLATVFVASALLTGTASSANAAGNPKDCFAYLLSSNTAYSQCPNGGPGYHYVAVRYRPPGSMTWADAEGPVTGKGAISSITVNGTIEIYVSVENP
ncbi:hypothetical protein [Sinosporangium siamense]|uniref:Uncharacterized protein n=1 Tax=Sinosporangium siamense TaxID=1367973 RepID=A0A919VD57_9ACTN|nr:hypothetical protein [Sinosporangium siamense]GII93799.1 hypothetical protein Ssi02_40300 [Sinosporangium siamense]